MALDTPPLLADILLAGQPPNPGFEVPALGEPIRLAFLLHPSDTTTADTQAVEVVVLDGDGNRVNGQTGEVNLTLDGSPTLVGSNLANLNAGVARFNQLSVQEAATGLTLTAKLGNLTAATSVPFDVAQAIDVQVNQSQSNQSEPDVDVSGAGNFVVVWSLDQGDGDEEGVFFRQFDANAEPAGSATLVNLTTAGGQDGPAVGVADNGNFMVAYETPNPVNPLAGPDLLARLFDANGTPLTSEEVIANTGLIEYQPRVAVDAAGNFVVGYDDAIGTGFAQFNAAGVFQDEVLDFGAQLDVAGNVGGTGIGLFVTVHVNTGIDGDGFGIQYILYDGNRNELVRGVANTTTAGNQLRPAVAMLPDGRFVVVWADENGADSDGKGIFGQRFSAAGAPLGDEFRVNSTTLGDQERPQIDFGPNTDFVGVWEGPDNDGKGVYSRRYDVNGNPLGAEQLVNRQTPLDQELPRVAVNSGGIFTVWEGVDAVEEVFYRFLP